MHTFNDDAQSGLNAWGKRASHPLRDGLFGGPNPHSRISLSDSFGRYATTPSEPVDRVKDATITLVYGYDDPQREVRNELGGLSGQGPLRRAHRKRGEPLRRRRVLEVLRRR